MGILRRIRAALSGTEYVGDALQEWLDYCADMGDERCAGYSLYDEFYNGEHRTKLRDRAREYLEDSTGVPFCENFAEPVVDMLAERLEVVGFTSSEADEKTETDAFADVADEWWQRNRMDAMQKTVHTLSLVRGDDFVFVEYDEDDGMPRFIRQQAHQVKVVYREDRPDEIDYAVKVWNTQQESEQNPDGRTIQRLNLYYPDVIEKYFRPSSGYQGKGGWDVYLGDGDNGVIEWLDGKGQPLGVPVAHFRNKPLGQGPKGDGCGRSRVLPVVSFQLELNKACADLNDLCDYHGDPQRWVTGVTGDTTYDSDHAVWQSPSPEAKFGQLDPADTRNLIEAVESIISRMARRSRIPMHLLTGGTPPSGESLKTAESGLVSTAEDCQVVFGNAWEDMLLIAFKVAATFGDGPEIPEDFTIETQWANAATRSDKDDLDTAILKKQLGVSNRTLLTELGYDPDKELEQSGMEKQEDMEREATAFDRGTPAGGTF